MSLQLTPDWRQVWTKAEMEKELLNGDFEFEGPGWYFTLMDSLLIIPMPGPGIKVTSKNAWNKKWPEGWKFEVNVYNSTFDHLIFSAVRWGYIPIRKCIEE